MLVKIPDERKTAQEILELLKTTKESKYNGTLEADNKEIGTNKFQFKKENINAGQKNSFDSRFAL